MRIAVGKLQKAQPKPVLIVDVEEIRRLLREFLEEAEFIVCGEAADGQAAIDQATALNSAGRYVDEHRAGSSVVPWPFVRHRSAPDVTGAVRSGRRKTVAQVQIARIWHGDDDHFVRRIGQAQRPTNRLP